MGLWVAASSVLGEIHSADGQVWAPEDVMPTVVGIAVGFGMRIPSLRVGFGFVLIRE